MDERARREDLGRPDGDHVQAVDDLVVVEIRSAEAVDRGRAFSPEDGSIAPVVQAWVGGKMAVRRKSGRMISL